MTEQTHPSDDPSPDPAGAAGIGGLLEGLLASLRRLFRHEIALFRAEVKQSLGHLRTGLILLVVAMIAGLVALNLAAATATAALIAAGVGPVLSPALVTLAMLAVAGLALWAALRRLSARNLTPRRTMAALKRNGETLVNMVKSDA